MEPTVYLFFKGNCLEAMTHYAEVLGGEIRGVFRNADATQLTYFAVAGQPIAVPKPAGLLLRSWTAKNTPDTMQGKHSMSGFS